MLPQSWMVVVTWSTYGWFSKMEKSTMKKDSYYQECYTQHPSHYKYAIQIMYADINANVDNLPHSEEAHLEACCKYWSVLK